MVDYCDHGGHCKVRVAMVSRSRGMECKSWGASSFSDFHSHDVLVQLLSFLPENCFGGKKHTNLDSRRNFEPHDGRYPLNPQVRPEGIGSHS